MIECNVPWSKLYNKRESNSHPNETTTCTHEHSWVAKMKTLMDHLIEESGEKRKFGHLPEARSDSTFQLGILASESFSERIRSAANILVDTRRDR